MFFSLAGPAVDAAPAAVPVCVIITTESTLNGAICFENACAIYYINITFIHIL